MFHVVSVENKSQDNVLLSMITLCSLSALHDNRLLFWSQSLKTWNYAHVGIQLKLGTGRSAEL